MIDLQLSIETSEFMKDYYSSARVLNQIARVALSEEMVAWFEKKLPGHFERPAHGKYGYAPRSRKYIGLKVLQYHHGEDLVRKQTAKHRTTSERKAVTFRGQAFGTGTGGLEGRLQPYWPHPRNEQGGLRKDGQPKVTPAQMSRELTSMTAEEQREMTRNFGERMILMLATRKYFGGKVTFYKSR